MQWGMTHVMLHKVGPKSSAEQEGKGDMPDVDQQLDPSCGLPYAVTCLQS